MSFAYFINLLNLWSINNNLVKIREHTYVERPLLYVKKKSREWVLQIQTSSVEFDFPKIAKFFHAVIKGMFKRYSIAPSKFHIKKIY